MERVIFTVTTGRSGTHWLAYLMGLHRGCEGVHEPPPSFADCMRAAQSDPRVADEFLRSRKLPAIRECAEPVYFEASHLFCKGFLEPWLEIKEAPVPDIVILNRAPREVALSMLRIGDIPVRRAKAAKWYLRPDDPMNFTCLEDWNALEDYQLCYWYTQEIEARKPVYARRVRSRGARVVTVSLSDLRTFRGVRRLRKQLAVGSMPPINWLRVVKNRHRRHDHRPSHEMTRTLSPDALARWEAEVRERLSPGDRRVAESLESAHPPQEDRP